MIKESKYIIRRILIGVGIVLVLSMINSCKVKAFDYNTEPYITQIDSSNVCWDGTCNRGNFNVYYNNENNSIDFIVLKNSNVVKSRTYSLDTYNYFYINRFGSSFQFVQCTEPLVKKNNSSAPVSMSSCTTGYNSGYPQAIYVYPSYTVNANFSFSTGNGTYSNFDIYNQNNELLQNANVSTSSPPPEFVSWNQTPISSNNLVIGYNFSPEFTTFDTDNYIYSYKFNNSSWLSLTENEQNIRVNANGTIYVQIKDRNTNEVIDSATFTITNVGQFYDSNVDYNIKITGEYRTDNYLNNNISSISSIIKEYQLYIDYFPKNSILKYQYQYILENNTLDPNAWETLSSSNNGSRTYVVSQNGTLYARILDSEDNVLSTATFVVNSIGKLALDNNDTKIDNFFTKISNKINYGGPVSSLFHIPVELLSSLYTSMSDSSTCSPFSLNQLLGVNMKYDCINFKNIVGNDFYNIIDMIFTFIISIGIFKFIIKLYNDLVSMNDIS